MTFIASEMRYSIICSAENVNDTLLKKGNSIRNLLKNCHGCSESDSAWETVTLNAMQQQTLA